MRLFINKTLNAVLFSERDIESNTITAFALHIRKPLSEKQVTAWKKLKFSIKHFAKEKSHKVSFSEKRSNSMITVRFIKDHSPNFPHVRSKKFIELLKDSGIDMIIFPAETIIKPEEEEKIVTLSAKDLRVIFTLLFYKGEVGHIDFVITSPLDELVELDKLYEMLLATNEWTRDERNPIHFTGEFSCITKAIKSLRQAVGNVC